MLVIFCPVIIKLQFKQRIIPLTYVFVPLALKTLKLTVFAARDDANLIETAFALRLLSNYDDELLDDYPDDYIEI